MKSFKSFLVIIFIGLIFLLPSCRPDVEDSYPDLDIYVYNFSQIFENFWHGMNRNYLYWDREPVSSIWFSAFANLPSNVRSNITAEPMAFWDIMYDYYKPKFAGLGEIAIADISSSPAAKTALDFFKEMTYGLCDGHFKIVFKDGSVIWPMNIRKEAGYIEEPVPGASGVFYYSNLSANIVNLDNIPDDEDDLQSYISDPEAYFRTYNFADKVISRYLNTSYDLVKDVSMGDNDPKFRFIRGTIPHSEGGIILYLSYNYCSIADLVNTNTNVSNIYNKFLTDLEKPEVKGIIMDMRGNRGGSLYDIGYFWGRIVDAPLTYSETRAKSGESRLKYGPWIPNRIIPAPAGQKKLGNKNAKIVFLVDGGTSSTAELMTMAAKAYGNGYVAGTKTMGAAGSASENNMTYNGGVFRMDHFIEYAGGAEVQNRSAADKVVYEGEGIKPDIEVEMTKTDWENFFGKNDASRKFTDKQLEEAIKAIDASRNFAGL